MTNVDQSLHVIDEGLSRMLTQNFLAESVAYGPQSNCQQDFDLVLNDSVNKSELYALRLLDATAKIPDGILIGNHQFMGQYYECLGVEHPEGQFYGKYCSLQLLNNNSESFNPAISYTLGFCVPSTCSAENLNFAFSESAISNTFTIIASDDDCFTAHDDHTFTGIDWFAIYLLITICTIVGISTIYELWQRKKLKNEKPDPLFSSFSMYQNGKALFEVRKAGGGQMDCLHGIRTMSMLWVIICHTSLLFTTGSVNNSLEALEEARSDSFMLISNGYLSVDTFFFLSGLLVTFVFFRDISRAGTYDVPRTYINRYIRLTPPYAFVILFQVTVVKYLGAGATWVDYSNFFESSCKTHWWSGLLYVQNLVNPDDQCLIQTWYLSADMQMYWVAPLVLYPLYFWPKIGVVFLGLVTVAAACWSFGIGLIYELPFSPFFDTSGYENSMDNYVPWSRVSPWLVGVLLGFIICALKAKNVEVKLKPIYVLLGWLTCGALLAASMFGIVWFLDNPDKVNVTNSAAFLAFHRLGWALGLAWLVFACIYGYGGFINTLLSWSAFQVLGKMSYCVYLVHVTVLIVVTGNFQTTLRAGWDTILIVFLTATVYSHIVAIPLSLLVELPFSNLDKLYLRSVKIFPYPKGVQKPKPRPHTQNLPNVGTNEAKELEEGDITKEKDVPQ